MPIYFYVYDTTKTSDSFEGWGYIGGISFMPGLGYKYGGGIKIPNGPFIPGDKLNFDLGGVDIGVSHNLTIWEKVD